MAFIFTVSCILMMYLTYLITHRICSVITVLTLPYAVLVPINNYLMVQYGFYKIQDEVIFMLLGAFVLIFSGSVAVDSYFSVRSQPSVRQKDAISEQISLIRWNWVLCYSWLVIIVTCLRLLKYIAGHGVTAIGEEAFSGYLVYGPLGHLLLSGAPLIPLMFFCWLRNPKKLRFLITSVCLMGLFFLTFVKYHVISIAVATYLLAALEDKKYLKSGGILLGAGGIGVFMMNYLVSFLVRGVTGRIQNSFYINHFWNYAAGSLIYDNRIFTDGIRTGVSIFYKLGSFVSAPLNLFLNALYGFRIFPHQTQEHYLVASNGEKGNVIDAIGYLYPSGGSPGDIILFAIVILMIGVLFAWIYNRLYFGSIRRRRLPVMLTFFLTYFVFLSFFGTFYINLVPYEILFWCWASAIAFDKRTVIRI